MIRSFFLLFIYFLPVVAIAQQVTADHLAITLDVKPGRRVLKKKKTKKEYEKAFKTACKRLGEAMSVGRGPWGFGVFASFSCFQGKKKVSGPDRAPRWTMDLIDSPKKFSIKMSYISPDGSRVEVTEIERPGSTSFLKFFLDYEFTDLVTLALLERLPMGMQLARANFRGSPPQFSGRHPRAGKSSSFKYQVPEPPEELILFRLAWDQPAKVWRSTVVGTARKIRIEKPKTKKRRKQFILQGGEVVYETSASIEEHLMQGPVWAQGSEGPGALSDTFDEMLGSAQMKLDDADKNGFLLDFINGKSLDVLSRLLSTAAAGYVAARYGLQLLSGDPILGKLSRFGLLLEMRGGPVKGLRYYYDKIPSVETVQPRSKLAIEQSGDFTTSLESARHVLGYSFDFNPGILFDRVTFDPKLGMWSFSATLPSELDTEGNVIDVKRFELGSTFSVALEVGLEVLSHWYTLRGWYSLDNGFSFIKTGGRVTSNRFGLDTYFTAGPSFPLFGVSFKTALLAFFVYENVSLTARDTKVPEAGEKEIQGVEYSSGFAGGGLGVTW